MPCGRLFLVLSWVTLLIFLRQFWKKNNAHSHCILMPDSWGGAIEISILSQYFNVEIAVVDTQSCRIDRFGEDKFYKERVFLYYDVIHYDHGTTRAELVNSDWVPDQRTSYGDRLRGQGFSTIHGCGKLLHSVLGVSEVTLWTNRGSGTCLGYRPYQLWGGVISQL